MDVWSLTILTKTKMISCHYLVAQCLLLYKPSDVCYFDETRPSLHTRGAAVERLGNTGLIGLSVSQLTDDTFTMHMMNGNYIISKYYM